MNVQNVANSIFQFLIVHVRTRFRSGHLWNILHQNAFEQDLGRSHDKRPQWNFFI